MNARIRFKGVMFLATAMAMLPLVLAAIFGTRKNLGPVPGLDLGDIRFNTVYETCDSPRYSCDDYSIYTSNIVYFDGNLFEDSDITVDGQGRVGAVTLSTSVGDFYRGLYANEEFDDHVRSVKHSLLTRIGRPIRTEGYKNGYIVIYRYGEITVRLTVQKEGSVRTCSLSFLSGIL